MKEFINGNEAIARGAIRAGCNFFAGYPITPATSILLHMTRELPKVGGIAIQGEDEIASIGFCIGAALAGSRVLTATSGPGISLCSESIGAAIMVEVPMVIVDVQRMGPATGGPTLGAYGDVQFIQWGNSGGYPIIALVPTNVAECFSLTMRAFDLAERFRVPVFLLTDKEIGLTKSTVNIDALVEYPVRDREKHQEFNEAAPYLSDDINTSSDVPKIPAYGGTRLVRLTTSSHTKAGYLTKDAESIRTHNEHLIAKIQEHLDEISLVRYDPHPGATTLIISYGITARAAQTAVQEIRDQGKPISHLILYSIWPVPEAEVKLALEDIKDIVLPELNLGLYRREIERLAGDQQQIHGINRLDGGLISPEEILKVVEAI
jgi:2-oxoglutarate ferredoxin oxidoreductase subunit alpha